MTCCSAVCYQCSCTQDCPLALSQVATDQRGGTGSCTALCALTTGEKPDSSASLSLSVSAVGSSPAAGSLFPCRSMRKRRKALRETEGILCLYTPLSHYLYYPGKLHRFPRSPRSPETTVTCCSHSLFPGSRAQVALPITPTSQPVFPCSTAAFHHTVSADLLPRCPFARAPPWEYGTPEKLRVKLGPYSSSHACGAASLLSYCSPVSSGQAPNACTSSGSARDRPPEARAEC